MNSDKATIGNTTLLKMELNVITNLIFVAGYVDYKLPIVYFIKIQVSAISTLMSNVINVIKLIRKSILK